MLQDKEEYAEADSCGTTVGGLLNTETGGLTSGATAGKYIYLSITIYISIYNNLYIYISIHISIYRVFILSVTINLLFGPLKCSKSNFNPVHVFLHFNRFVLEVLKLILASKLSEIQQFKNRAANYQLASIK